MTRKEPFGTDWINLKETGQFDEKPARLTALQEACDSHGSAGSPSRGGPKSAKKELADLENVSTDSKLNFDWDSAKSAGNEAKHGLSLAAASALWAGPVVALPSKRPGELRHLAVGLIEGRHWTVVYAPRSDRLRVISGRRSRKNEKALFKKLLG
jgi:uncharacterized DUF497 family protein